MVSDTDRLALPHGVALADGQLADAVRGTSWPLNASGSFVLARPDYTVGQIAAELARAFSVTAETARDDVLRFVFTLNALALINVERRGSAIRNLADWVRLAARLVPVGALPSPVARRRPLDTTSVPRAVGSCLVATLPRVIVIAGVCAVVLAHVGVVVGVVVFLAPLLLGIATGAGLALHEAAHAAALRGVPSALVVKGRRTYVLHARVSASRRLGVAVAGPLVTVAFGLVLIHAGVVLAAPGIAIAGCPLAAHVLALTVVSGDGRVACGL